MYKIKFYCSIRRNIAEGENYSSYFNVLRGQKSL